MGKVFEDYLSDIQKEMLAPFFPENVVDGYTSWSTDVPENSMTTSFFWYALSEIEKPDTEL